MDVASWISDWWSWSVPATMQATLLLALAWSMDRLLVRRVWPGLLAVFWFVALARFFLPPDLRSPLSVTAVIGAPTLAAAKFLPGANTLTVLFAVWVGGTVALIALRCARRLRLDFRVEFVTPSHQWRRAMERAAAIIGTHRKPRIGTLEGLGSPAVFGLFRPTLLLPRSSLDRPPTRRDEHALLHELAHLKRGDLWLDECLALIRAAVWFHPLVWIASERLRVLGELQCDQTVARALGSEARSYRDTLVLAARHLATRTTPSGVRAFIGGQSAIIVRIESLERCATHSLTLARGVSAASAIVLAACVLPMAPSVTDLRAQALHVFAAERNGELQSCFVKQAAAMVLASDSSRHASNP